MSGEGSCALVPVETTPDPTDSVAGSSGEDTSSRERSPSPSLLLSPALLRQDPPGWFKDSVKSILQQTDEALEQLLQSPASLAPGNAYGVSQSVTGAAGQDQDSPFW